ncbi:hypothetical protein C0995_005327 [Termitomyces sp. Mi166|nr:hypothetical protein C0995_005327 [Termitomyces sp. Mi166\
MSGSMRLFHYDYYFVCGIILPIEELRTLGRRLRGEKAANDSDEDLESTAMKWLRAFGFVMKWVADPAAEHRFAPTEELPMIVCRRWRMLTPQERQSLSDSLKNKDLEERLPETELERPVFDALQAKLSIEGAYFARSVAVFP